MATTTVSIADMRGNRDSIVFLGECVSATNHQDDNEWEPSFHESKQAFLGTLQWFRYLWDYLSVIAITVHKDSWPRHAL